LTFWVMRTVTNYLLPHCYFTASMCDIVVDTKVFQIMLTELFPKISSHLEKWNVDVSVIIPKWFLTLFCGSLPPETRMRVLDGFLYEGDKILFRVGFALFALNQADILASDETSTLLQTCMDLPRTATDPKILMEYAYSFNFSRSWISKLRAQIREAHNIFPSPEELQDDILPARAFITKNIDWSEFKIIDNYSTELQNLNIRKDAKKPTIFSEINATLIGQS